MARPVIKPPSGQEQRLTMSYEEFLEWADEDSHAEWVDGEVIVFMPPKRVHQRLLNFLSVLLSTYARFFGFGEVLEAPFEMRLGRGKPSREPDLLFVAREHLDRLTEERLNGPADLIVELVSDSSVARDYEEKFREYEAAGVREYWICDPRPGTQQTAFYQLTAEGKYQAVPPDAEGRYHALVLPGFWLDPAWLWQEPLPDPLTALATIAPQALRGALTAAESGRQAEGETPTRGT